MTDSASKPGIDVSSIKNQLQQLMGLRDSGALSEDAYLDAKDALERKLIDWALLQSAAAQGATPTHLVDAPIPGEQDLTTDVKPVTQELAEVKAGKRALPMVAGIAVLAALAGGGYFLFGRSEGTPVMPLPASSMSTPLMPRPAGDAVGADKTPHTNQVADIGTLAEKLAARLAKQPNDPQGWAMLGRSYSVLGNPAEAVKAYEKAVAMLPDDKALKADYAAALAEVKKNNLAATGGAVSQALAVASAQLPSTGQAPSAAANASVSGTVTLAAALTKSTQPTDTVFVVARPQEGSRMPLAVVRKQVKDLPLQFTLDDTMSMSPAAKLSTAGKVIVSARISKSGNAIPEKGDLTGEITGVAVGAKSLSIVINTTVK